MTEKEKEIIKQYSFLKSQLSDIREAFICMNEDAKDNEEFRLMTKTLSLIENLELIGDEMIDEDDSDELKKDLLDMCNN